MAKGDYRSIVNSPNQNFSNPRLTPTSIPQLGMGASNIPSSMQNPFQTPPTTQPFSSMSSSGLGQDDLTKKLLALFQGQ